MLNNLGTSYFRQGKYEQAKPFFEKAFEAATAAGEDLMIAVVLSNLGDVSRIMSAYEASARYYEESLAMFRKMQEQRWTAASLNGLGGTLVEMGEISAAKRCLQEGLEISRAIQSIPDALDSLAGLSEILAREADQQKAVGVASFVANHGIARTTARERAEQLLVRLKDEMPAGVWEVAYEQGKAQPLEAVVSELSRPI